MIEVYVCNRLLGQDMAEQCYLANELCGELIEHEEFDNSIDKYNNISPYSDNEFNNITSNILSNLFSILNDK